MKSVFIIAIVAVAMIGVMVPDALGTKYVNESPYEFSIDYPYGWQVDGIQEVDSARDFIENGVIIQDKDDWTTIMTIQILEDLNPQFSDDKEVDIMNEVERDFCNNLTFNNDGMICYDFALLSERDNSMVYEINGYRAITIFYEHTNVYLDSNFSGEYQIIGTTTHIYAENDMWVIFSISNDWVFDKHSDLILDTVASFRFENDAIPKEGTSVQQSLPAVQQPTAQNTCPDGTPPEIRGVNMVCVSKKTVEKTCPDGTYLGVDNNGNSACRSVQTNQISNEQNKETTTTPPKPQEQKPIPMLDDDNFKILIIVGVAVIAIIIFAAKKKSKTVNQKNTGESDSQDTSSPPVDPKYKKESPRTPIRSETKKEPKKSSSTRQKTPTKTATSASSSTLDPEYNAPKTPSEALDELARKINPDYKTKSTSPPPVDPKYATESTKGPIQSEPKKSQKKASQTMPKQPKRTVDSTIDSELDRILNATNPLEVLGLPTGTSYSVIRARYRELTIKYDPSKGIVNKSDIEKQRDQKVSTNLNRAYGQLKRQNRG
jgi:hypothetical protein